MELIPFQIIFEGKLKEGADPAKAAEALARTFRLSPDAVRPLLSGRPIVIKKGLTRELAEKYKATLEGIGYEARIEKELTLEGATDEVEKAKPKSEPAPISCPKCGHRFHASSSSVPSDECPKCGVILSKVVAQPKGAEQARGTPPVEKPASPASHTSQDNEIDFGEPGFPRKLFALEFTLPETLTLPSNEARWEPAPLETRFFAALASLASWLYCSLLIANLAVLVMVLLAMTGTQPRMLIIDMVAVTMISAVLVAAPYQLVYLPLRWNGLTYGQRLMGIWVAQKEWGDQPIGFGIILRRFAGTVLNFTCCGGLNLLLPHIAGGKNLADAFSSTVQVRGRTGREQGNPALAALQPIAYAVLCLLVINSIAKPVVLYAARNSAKQPAVSKVDQEVLDHWKKVGEVQNRQAEHMKAKSGGGPGVDSAPQARVPAATARIRNFADTPRAPEILNGLANMQKKYFAANNRYAQDLDELLRLYGRGQFSSSGPVSEMIRADEVKMETTATGFEIRVKFEGVWQTISERGEMGIRP